MRRLFYLAGTVAQIVLLLCFLGMFTYAGETGFEEDEFLDRVTEVMNDENPSGDAGRLFIPSVGINVALYESYCDADYNSYSQNLTDAQDSAAFYRSWNGGCNEVIADHWNQGFIGIKDCLPGTLAFIRHGENISVFECTETLLGYNRESEIVTTDGREPDFMPGIDMYAYTCRNGWREVYITTFKLIKKIQEN